MQCCQLECVKFDGEMRKSSASNPTHNKWFDKALTNELLFVFRNVHRLLLQWNIVHQGLTYTFTGCEKFYHTGNSARRFRFRKIVNKNKMPAGKKLTREEELLLQDFSRNVSTKSSALFYGNSFIVSAIPICKFYYWFSPPKKSVTYVLVKYVQVLLNA